MFWLSTRLMAKPSKSDTRVSNRSTVILGVLLFIPSLLMTSTIINSWAPYYAAFPMLGVSLLAALGLERLPKQGQLSAVALFLVLGIWARGSDIATTHITERSLRPSSVALKKIEAGFLAVVPRLEPNTDILLSVQVRGLRRVYAQLYAFQPPRLWYRDLSLRVLKPLRVKPSDRPVVLVVIPSNLDVVFLNPVTFQTVSASGNPPDYYACERALRALAVGLGASSPDRGMHLLLRIPNPTPEIKSAHMRAAAMLQLAAGHEAVAESLIAAAPPLSRQSTLNDLHVLLAEQPTGLIVDDYALSAFGIRQDDIETLRELAGWLSKLGYAEAAHRFASKLLALSPADPVGLRAMTVSDSLLVERRKWPEELL
jgi:hypothetical protein